MPRAYRQKRRAELQEQTRQRIVEAAVDLHGTVGPAETTISAIADQAGVQRVTVYKHFPDEATLFAACTAHWQASNPPPDPAPLSTITDSRLRLRLALGGLYAWYAANERMLANGIRDMPRKPELAASVAPLFDMLGTIGALLAAGWDDGDPHPLRVAAIGHALEFTTWTSLVSHQSLSPEGAIDLMVRFIETAGDVMAPIPPSSP